MSCLSILVALAAVNVTNVTVPVAFGSLSSVHCARVVVPPLAVRVDSSGASVILNGTATTIDCDLLFADENVISVGLTLPAKASVRIDGNASGDCMPSGASVTACTMLPHVTLSSPNPLWDLVLSGIAGAINGAAPQLCADLALALNGTISNASTPRPETLPPLQPGQTDLRLWPLGRAIGEIVAALPVLFETLRIGCVVRADALGLSLQLLRDVDISDGASVALHIPAGFAVDVDVVLRGLVCGDGGFACTLDAHQPVSLENLKAINGGAFSYIMNYVALPEAESLINAVLVRNDSHRPSFSFSPFDVSQRPPFYVAVVMAFVVTLLTAALLSIVIVRRCCLGVPQYRRGCVECLVVVCIGACIYAFCWLNGSTTAAVYVAGVLPLHSFGLGVSVPQLWEAGLYSLSMFVATFNGALPYFKLILVAIYGVILRRRGNRVLRLIDAVGKLSLLNGFVLIMTYTGMRIPGIVEIEFLPCYYGFTANTLASMAMGSVALYGLHTKEDGRIERPRPRLWVSLPLAAGVLAMSLASTFGGAVTFHRSGLVSLIEPDVTMSMWSMMTGAGGAVVALYVTTIVVAPTVFVATFPWCPALGAWCATDALLLACLSGLLQLDQSVAFSLGALHPSVYACTATLHWPVYAMLATVAVHWGFMGWTLVGTTYTDVEGGGEVDEFSTNSMAHLIRKSTRSYRSTA